MAVTIKCPYYRYENWLKIQCEGKEKKKFEQHLDMRKYEHIYCCKHWNDCENAKILNEYYDKREMMQIEYLYARQQQHKKKALQEEINSKKQEVKTTYEKSPKKVEQSNIRKTSSIIQSNVIQTSYGLQVHEIYDPKEARRN